MIVFNVFTLSLVFLVGVCGANAEALPSCVEFDPLLDEVDMRVKVFKGNDDWVLFCNRPQKGNDDWVTFCNRPQKGNDNRLGDEIVDRVAEPKNVVKDLEAGTKFFEDPTALSRGFGSVRIRCLEQAGPKT